jgi:hypothetical protein
MGWFLSLVAATLERSDDDFIQRNELLQFGSEVFVAWCRPGRGAIPAGWSTLADNTLRVKTEPGRWVERVEFETNPVYPADDPRTFEYYAEGFGMPIYDVSAIFHLAFPPGYLPQLPTIDPFPLYAWQHAERFVLGWVWQHGVSFRLRFGAVEPASYAANASSLQAAFRTAKAQRQRQGVPMESRLALEQEIESCNRQLRTLRGNLLHLEEQKALYGPIHLPIDLMNSIRLTQEDLEQLEERRAALEARRETLPW